MKIYDSATQTLREFTPLEPGKVGIYVCGATVQGSPHIGHIRSALAFDVLVRWLKKCGYDVRLVRNVTDIDDKILAKSRQAGRPWWAHAYIYEQEFAAAYRTLGILPPTYEPRATGHIPQMIELIQEIMDAGHAYVGNPGNVYMDVASLPEYGSLTRQKLENMVADESDTEPDKRGPHDFALWKAPKEGEPESASWESPWGRGRPGWHLECSAMSGRYLGDTFDIHGGGIDLRFPHHENELAQSRAAGREFARYWMHNAWVTIQGEKMSKSLGNSLTVENICREVDPAVLRLALGTVHYRSTVAYSPETLAEAKAVWDRLAGFVARSARIGGEASRQEVEDYPIEKLPSAFTDAMDDDVNVAGALAAIFDAVKAGNTVAHEAAKARKQAEKVEKTAAVADAHLMVRAMLDVLGLDPLAQPWRKSGADKGQEALESVVKVLLDQREEARHAKDWAQADNLRDVLKAAHIVVEDSPEGARWHIED